MAFIQRWNKISYRKEKQATITMSWFWKHLACRFRANSRLIIFKNKAITKFLKFYLVRKTLMQKNDSNLNSFIFWSTHFCFPCCLKKESTLKRKTNQPTLHWKRHMSLPGNSPADLLTQSSNYWCPENEGRHNTCWSIWYQKYLYQFIELSENENITNDKKAC